MVILYILTFGMTLFLSLMLTPIIRDVSIEMKWVDKPNQRKVNVRPVPLLGGIAIYAAFAIPLLILLPAGKFVYDINKLYGLLGGSFVIFMAGIHDDIKGLTPRRKLFYQITASMIAYVSGYTINLIRNPFGEPLQFPFLISIAVTTFWIVGFTNAVNLLDGLDGLAAGISAIVAGSLFFFALAVGNALMALLSVALIGSTLGFLRYNFYPAKIFMGDSGSMFLGYVLSLIAIEGSYKGATFVTVLLPVIAMAVPVLDTGLAIVRRLASGKGIFKADKEHIHHKLLLKEGSQKRAVLTLYSLTICFGLIAIGLSGIKGVWAHAGMAVTAVLTVRWVINHGLLDFVRNGFSK